LGVNENNLWKLEVEDDGLGMSEEVLDRAFEPFFSTRPKSQSSGLGLTHLHRFSKIARGTGNN
jgi:signal transduction histidine kinase